MSTPEQLSPDPTPAATRPARPPQGTPAELEDTQRWWLRWIYGPVMGLIGLAALVTGAAGTGDRTLSLTLAFMVVVALGSAFVSFRAQHRTTGRLALDERAETANMRTLGYGWCFAFFAALAWAVAWAATDDGGMPVPLIVLAGLVLCAGFGRLCTRREGF